MAALKAHEVERFLAKSQLPKALYLIYGPDAGLVRERGRNLAKHFSDEKNGGFALTSLDMSEIEQDPDRLPIEARTSSLFGGQPIVRVRNANKKISAAVLDLLADWPDAVVIIEAANLTPKDKFRASVEKSENGMAIPCYADGPEDRARLIDDMMKKHGITLEPDARVTLRDILGNDREISRRELEKLCLFAAESKIITRADVELLCGDNAATTLDQIVDAVGSGNLDKLQISLASAQSSGIDSQRILLATLNHFKWLREKTAEAAISGKRPIDAMNSGWPRPHFSRKNGLELQARLWSDQALKMANQRLHANVLATRKEPAIADAIVSRALISLAARVAKR